MVPVQSFVNAMGDSIDYMKITPKQKEFAKAVMRAAIDYANAKHGMHATPNAREAASVSSTHSLKQEG